MVPVLESVYSKNVVSKRLEEEAGLHSLNVITRTPSPWGGVTWFNQLYPVWTSNETNILRTRADILIIVRI